jgi:hypothetical protein
MSLTEAVTTVYVVRNDYEVCNIEIVCALTVVIMPSKKDYDIKYGTENLK